MLVTLILLMLTPASFQIVVHQKAEWHLVLFGLGLFVSLVLGPLVEREHVSIHVLLSFDVFIKSFLYVIYRFSVSRG